MNIPAGVAAHHPDTAAAGLEILAAGGSAVDAAVAATLASCVTETTMTGLGGGGHAITWDAGTGVARTFDFFVAVPGLDGTPDTSDPATVDVVFEVEPVPYTIGSGTVGVPGVAAGCEALWRSAGRLPWSDLVAPALRLARTGAVLPPTHARVLAMLAQVLTLNEGGEIYAPGGTLVGPDGLVRVPGLVTALELLRDEGASTFYRGSIAKVLLELLRERGSPLGEADLEAYAVVEAEPAETVYEGRRVLARRDLAGMLDALGRLPSLRGLDPGGRALALVTALAGREGPGHTTNVAVADAEGNACVATTSLGLGSGDWLPGLDIHLNSMLGEVDLQRGVPVPGTRMGSMIVPTVVVGGGGLEVAAGAGGGSRIRSALVQTLAGLLAEDLGPGEAVEQARLHPVGDVVHTEPDFAPSAVDALGAAGYEVRRWRTRHHYFGGVSLVSRGGPAADSRRDGAVRRLDA